MFASIDEAIEYWKEEYSFIVSADVVDYVGGYPVVDFLLKDEVCDVIKDSKSFKRIIRTAEMEGGIEVGVSYCFKDTASIDWQKPHLKICGYPEVINRIFKKLI